MQCYQKQKFKSEWNVLKRTLPQVIELTGEHTHALLLIEMHKSLELRLYLINQIKKLISLLLTTKSDITFHIKNHGLGGIMIKEYTILYFLCKSIL